MAKKGNEKLQEKDKGKIKIKVKTDSIYEEKKDLHINVNKSSLKWSLLRSMKYSVTDFKIHIKIPTRHTICTPWFVLNLFSYDSAT